jgi:hypothetical protein
MRNFIQRLSVLLGGILFAAFCNAVYVGLELPTSWDLAHRAEAWAWMMTGPIFLVVLGVSASPTYVASAVTLAWMSIPLIFAHPVRPGKLTAGLTLSALFLWFHAGWLALIMAVWGA